MRLNKLNLKQKIEFVFDLLYLVIVGILGLILVSGDDAVTFLWGVMALVLVIGDSFHLTPRILEMFVGKNSELTRRKGRGKLIASITMSIFYSLMYAVGGVLYIDNPIGDVGILMTILLILRIILCILPHNGWAKTHQNMRFAILRNIPLLLQGILVFILYLNSPPFEGMGLAPFAVFLSFAFYIPVVLYVDRKPILGMLMLPKSIVYIWIVTMGFSL